MARTGPPTVLFEVFWTHQKRKRLIETALAHSDLPPEDYPIYVLIGAEGPWTPTGLAALDGDLPGEAHRAPRRRRARPQSRRRPFVPDPADAEGETFARPREAC